MAFLEIADFIIVPIFRHDRIERRRCQYGGFEISFIGGEQRRGTFPSQKSVHVPVYDSKDRIVLAFVAEKINGLHHIVLGVRDYDPDILPVDEFPVEAAVADPFHH